MIFAKKKKIREVLSAKELLRVASVEKKLPESLKYIIFILITLVYLYALNINQGEDTFMIWIVIVSMLYLLMLVVIIRFTKGRGASLVITEKGVVINPMLAELWEDINKYGWETFKGTTKTSFFSKREGTSLLILNKGTFQRNTETWTGHTMLGQYGIIFTPEQIEKADRIFKEYGVNKYEG